MPTDTVRLTVAQATLPTTIRTIPPRPRVIMAIEIGVLLSGHMYDRSFSVTLGAPA